MPDSGQIQSIIDRMDQRTRVAVRVVVCIVVAAAISIAFLGWQLDAANDQVDQVREVQAQQQEASEVSQCRNAITSRTLLGVGGGLVFIGDFLRGLNPDGTVTLTPEQIAAANRAYDTLSEVRPDLQGLVDADRSGDQSLSPCPTNDP